MPISRAFVAVFLCSAAAAAQQPEPLIARPITLPEGKFDVTFHGTYTNWESEPIVGGTGSLEGETVALGADFGIGGSQIGIAVALPIHPGAAFGSVLISETFALDPHIAGRVDLGFESIGFNGDVPGGTSHTSRYFTGLGFPLKVPLSSTVAFVSGRTGAVQFGHFNNLGQGDTGLYFGGSFFTEGAADNLVLSGGDNSSATIFGINVPLGLLVQPSPLLALTLSAGYSAMVIIPNGGSTEALHYVPIGLEATVSPAQAIDLGVRFFVDGYVANSGAGGSGPGYFDLRALMFWIKFRA
jgi:hypothetical protein